MPTPNPLNSTPEPIAPDAAWARFKTQVAQTQDLVAREQARTRGRLPDNFIDLTLLSWLSEAAESCHDVKSAFQYTARRMLYTVMDRGTGHLAFNCVADRRVSHWLNFFESCEPDSRFIPPAEDRSSAKLADELIECTEADYGRYKPFLEVLQKFLTSSGLGREGHEGRDDSAAPFHFIDAGTGPHALWAVWAAAMYEDLSDNPHPHPDLRICAIEQDADLALRAQAFVDLLGYSDQIKIMRADITGAGLHALHEHARSYGTAFGIDAAAPRWCAQDVRRLMGEDFSPKLILSETHCPGLFKEDGDLILRTLSRAYPQAQLAPAGVQFTLLAVPWEEFQPHAMRERWAQWPQDYVHQHSPVFSHKAPTGTTGTTGTTDIKGAAGAGGTGDDVNAADAQQRREVRLTLNLPRHHRPSALVLNTTFYFPFNVAPLHPRDSVITESYALCQIPGEMAEVKMRGASFLSNAWGGNPYGADPKNHLWTSDRITRPQIELRWVMGASLERFTVDHSSPESCVLHAHHVAALPSAPPPAPAAQITRTTPAATGPGCLH